MLANFQNLSYCINKFLWGNQKKFIFNPSMLSICKKKVAYIKSLIHNISDSNNQISWNRSTFLAHAPIGCNELMAYRCVYLSVYPSTIRKCFFSNMPWWIFLILGYSDHQVGGQQGCSRIWGQRSSRGHLGSLFKYAQMLLRLHDSIDFDETWVKRSLARGSFGVFRKFWSEAVLGSLGVAFDHWVFNLLKTAAKEKS